MMQARPGDHVVDTWPPAITRVELRSAEDASTGGVRGLRSDDDDLTGTHGGVHTAVRRSGPGAPGHAAIAAGYHWLRLIPTGAPRPIAVLLAVVVVPATYGLTRRISGPGTGWIRTVARGCAVLLPALWVVLLLAHDVVVADVLGVVSLALALSLVALAVLSEVGEHQPTGTH